MGARCAIGGDAGWYTTLRGAPKGFARGLYDSGSVLHDDPAAHDAARAHATRCGVGIVSPNYIQPRDLDAFVWTWDRGEPRSGIGGARCVVQRPNERWALMECNEARRHAQLACRAEDDDRTWRVAEVAAGCAPGFVARPPTNGFANALLRQAAGGTTSAALLLLNVSEDGRSPSPGLDQAGGGL